jgi:mono/diheme cytochrome c family protein
MQLVQSRFVSDVLERNVPEPAKVVRRYQAAPRQSSWRKWARRAAGAVMTLAGLFLITGFIAQRIELNRMMADADPARGRSFYKQSCIVCHGANYQGMPHQGVSLRDSTFIAGRSNEELWNFLKVGRKPDDKQSKTKLLMPPRGANPNLDDEDLMDVVAFLRTVQAQPIAPAPVKAGM